MNQCIESKSKSIDTTRWHRTGQFRNPGVSGIRGLCHGTAFLLLAGAYGGMGGHPRLRRVFRGHLLRHWFFDATGGPVSAGDHDVRGVLSPFDGRCPGLPLGHVSNYSYDFEEPLLYSLIFLMFWFNGAGPLSVYSIIYKSISKEQEDGGEN
jgi:hypothetical protein